MPMEFTTYLTNLADAITNENGPNLAFLLRPTSPHGKDLVKEFRNPNREMFRRFENAIVNPFDEIAVQYVMVCHHIAKKRYVEAFKEESQLVSLFYRYLPDHRGWTLPALFSILKDLRDLAYDADTHARITTPSQDQPSQELKTDAMEEAARIISKAFGLCMTDRISPPMESRKWGVYYIVGLVLKCYFRVKRISLSKNILRALDANNDIPPLTSYPRSHQVTFRYYIGMLSFLNEDFAKAEQELTLAFYECDNRAHRNKERILAYLIPLRVLKGHLPTPELLARFPRYDAALEKGETRLLELNLWLSLEKAAGALFEGACFGKWLAADRSTRMPISMFHVGLKIAGIDVAVEEAECYVANMIYRGFIRGYISHEKQTVVLAASNTFPKVADRPNPFGGLGL
ncbi:hypothetical protein DFP72DRAFT_1061270 [Ephemerocybe angulata]|uniref:PCI domain-containing protein n=1 Tax=Ephemerocybe angulata TaxID=980116 RepID=A0A8H6MFC8_9AGAR|nr:hypothetical protein DFP72DRAFT_1061270 [Tulosesus angulatus]